MPEETIQPDRQNLPATVLTIFGISGNLSQNKLLPALYHLLKRNMLPEQFAVVGVIRKESKDIDNLLQQVEINLLRKHIDVDQHIMQRLKELITTIVMDSTNPEDYRHLRDHLENIDNQNGIKFQRLFYLAIPPSIFGQVINCLGDEQLNIESDDVARRILVEKPFGTNLISARNLCHSMSQSFGEHQIYRIDHYLAKENAQNILTFRFNNPIIEDIWGRQFIDHIQISALERIGIDSRSNFYENMGALRDIIQSHLMQLVVLVMMEAPKELTSQSIHEEKLALLNAIQPIKQNHVDELAVSGQYAGYREEVNNPESNIETYAALCLEVANSRWGGVPVLLRTGKALNDHSTYINIVFKDRSRRSVPANVLTIRIQPDEGIAIKLTAKKPGFTDEFLPVDMDFSYQNSFDEDAPDAYERVLVDCITGDQSLFASSEEVLRSWEILEPVLEYWQYHSSQPTVYEQGGNGPNDADALAASFGSEWL